MLANRRQVPVVLLYSLPDTSYAWPASMHSRITFPGNLFRIVCISTARFTSCLYFSVAVNTSSTSNCSTSRRFPASVRNKHSIRLLQARSIHSCRPEGARHTAYCCTAQPRLRRAASSSSKSSRICIPIRIRSSRLCASRSWNVLLDFIVMSSIYSAIPVLRIRRASTR